MAETMTPEEIKALFETQHGIILDEVTALEDGIYFVTYTKLSGEQFFGTFDTENQECYILTESLMRRFVKAVQSVLVKKKQK